MHILKARSTEPFKPHLTTVRYLEHLSIAHPGVASIARLILSCEDPCVSHNIRDFADVAWC